MSTTVAKPREEVFDYLDVLENHASFMDHMFDKWTFSGPKRGIGAQGRARVAAPGSREFAEFEVIESERPLRSVERGISAHGKRETRGTYRFEEAGEGKTLIEFELQWLEVPRSEKLVPGLARVFMRRALGKAMRRLNKELEAG